MVRRPLGAALLPPPRDIPSRLPAPDRAPRRFKLRCLCSHMILEHRINQRQRRGIAHGQLPANVITFHHRR